MFTFQVDRSWRDEHQRRERISTKVRAERTIDQQIIAIHSHVRFSRTFENELNIAGHRLVRLSSSSTLTWIWWMGVGCKLSTVTRYNCSPVKRRNASSWLAQAISWISKQSNGNGADFIIMVSMWIKRSCRSSRRRVWLGETSKTRHGESNSKRLIKFLPRPSSVCSNADAVSGCGLAIDGVNDCRD